VTYSLISRHRLCISPIRRVRHFRDAGFQNNVEVPALFDQNIFSLTFVLAVETHYGMPSRSGTGKKIKDD
jgi:hypothetical protein